MKPRLTVTLFFNVTCSTVPIILILLKFTIETVNLRWFIFDFSGFAGQLFVFEFDCKFIYHDQPQLTYIPPYFGRMFE